MAELQVDIKRAYVCDHGPEGYVNVAVSNWGAEIPVDPAEKDAGVLFEIGYAHCDDTSGTEIVFSLTADSAKEIAAVAQLPKEDEWMKASHAKAKKKAKSDDAAEENGSGEGSAPKVRRIEPVLAAGGGVKMPLYGYTTR